MVTEPTQEAFKALARLYKSVDRRTRSRRCAMCGECCYFETFGHRLYATHLEALYLFAVSGAPPAPFDRDHCGYQKESLCLARDGRVLGCRTFFCDGAGGYCGELHEQALGEIRRISDRFNIPDEYAPLADILRTIQAPDASELLPPA